MSVVNTRTNIIAVTLLIALASSHLRREQRPVTYPLRDEVLAGMTLANLTPGQKRQVMEAASSLFTGRCTEAFITSGLRSPYEVVVTTGVVFRPSTDVYTHSARELGLRDERTRKAYAMEFSSGRAQAGTVSPMRRGIALTLDGRARVFLHDTAFYGESFWLGTISLREVLIHEFIHVGGQPPTPGWLGPLRHDLAGFAHYSRIMQACK